MMMANMVVQVQLRDSRKALVDWARCANLNQIASR